MREEGSLARRAYLLLVEERGLKRFMYERPPYAGITLRLAVATEWPVRSGDFTGFDLAVESCPICGHAARA